MRKIDNIWYVPLLLIIILFSMERPLFCSCNNFYLIIGSTNSHHTSQHFFDPYSLSHFQHGMIFFLFLKNFLKVKKPFFLGLVIESLWEIIENTSFIINKYRSETIAFDYSGDTIINSMGDLFSCYFGLVVTSRLKVSYSILLYLLVECGMLLIYRDSLTLNILMLTYPLESVKTWQLFK